VARSNRFSDFSTRLAKQKEAEKAATLLRFLGLENLRDHPARNLVKKGLPHIAAGASGESKKVHPAVIRPLEKLAGVEGRIGK
jgi:hypothetical protein